MNAAADMRSHPSPVVATGASASTGVIDFPIMLWLASSVFNVDWSDPIGLPLAISIVISLLGTAGSAWGLYHLGHNRRENKNDRRQLAWPDLSAGAKISLIGVALLVALIAVVMFVRVYTEDVLSGLDWLALLLAVLIAFIMLLSAALVFSTAFRDGSPEQDDLAHYSTHVQDGLQRKRALEDRADQLRGELGMLLGRIGLDPSTVTETDPTETHTPTGAREHSANEAATNGVSSITSIEACFTTDGPTKGETNMAALRSRLFRLFGILSATTVCLTLTTQSASAAPPLGGDYKDTEGAAAECVLSYTDYRVMGHIECILYDHGEDGDAVYVAWNSDNYPGWLRIYNRNGYGSERYFTRDRFIEYGHRLEWKVCVDRGTVFRDNCSRTVIWEF